MPNLEFEKHHQIVSPLGVLDLNAIVVDSTGTGDPYVFKVLSTNYKIVPTMRVAQDNVSQQPGSVIHPPFTSGLLATMTIQYSISVDGVSIIEVTSPCGADLRRMHELLTMHLNALLYPSADPNTFQRLIWYPSGVGARMLTAVQTQAWTEPSFTEPFWEVTFSLACPFPYAIDASEVDVPLTDGGGPTAVPNGGTAPYYPVIEVAGPTSAFTLTNTDNGLAVVYSGTAIGGGHHVELDFFNGTAFLDGSSSDLVDSIDPTLSDWFTIGRPGGSNLEITGANATVKANNAYA